MQRFSLPCGGGLCMTVLLLLLACTPKTSFLILDRYSDSSFSGSDLSGAQIILTPVLKGGAALSAAQVDQDRLIRDLKRDRHDLSFVSAELFELSLSESLGIHSVEEFYKGLFESDHLVLKSLDREWGMVPGQFLFVTRVLAGANVRSIEGKAVRRVKMEGELWRTGDAGVVWRTSVLVVSTDTGESDSRLIKRGIVTLCDSLPTVLPGYGYEGW